MIGAFVTNRSISQHTYDKQHGKTTLVNKQITEVLVFNSFTSLTIHAQ